MGVNDNNWDRLNHGYQPRKNEERGYQPNKETAVKKPTIYIPPTKRNGNNNNG